MSNNNNNTSNCGCGSGCCCVSEDINTPSLKKQMIIDFLFLDLSVCTRCQGADDSLDQAIAEVSKVLEMTGIEVVVNKINVISEEIAAAYQFISSPTIRVNGHDIQMDVKESLCESCGDLCGDEVDCRVWTYQGKDYTVPPKAMIIEALLKEVYGDADNHQEEKDYVLPENLRSFYTSMNKKAENINTDNPCCISSTKGSCC